MEKTTKEKTSQSCHRRGRLKGDNRGKKVSIFRNGWERLGSSFIGLVTNSWGPGTKLKKRLARGDLGINRLDKIGKQPDIDYARAKNLQDK